MRAEDATRIFELVKSLREHGQEIREIDAKIEELTGRRLSLNDACVGIRAEIESFTPYDPVDGELLEFPSELQRTLEGAIRARGLTRESFKRRIHIRSMKELTKGQAKHLIKRLETADDSYLNAGE